MLRLTKYSLIKTVGLLTAISLIPVAITEAADGDLSEYTNLLIIYLFQYI